MLQKPLCSLQHPSKIIRKLRCVVFMSYSVKVFSQRGKQIIWYSVVQFRHFWLQSPLCVVQLVFLMAGPLERKGFVLFSPCS